MSDEEFIDISDKRNELLFKLENIEIKDSPFLGTLESLYELIKNYEVNPYDVSLSTITDQFLAMLREEANNEVNLDNMSSFYRMIAILLYVKSQLLLPIEDIDHEDIFDSYIELTDNIIEFEKLKKYSILLENYEGSGGVYYERKKTHFRIPFEDEELWKDVEVGDLLTSFKHVLENKPSDKVFNVYEEVTVDSKIVLMEELFTVADSIDFEEVVVYLDSYMDIICAFLAILESVKWGFITIKQHVLYGNIKIFKLKDRFDGKLTSINGDEDDSEDIDDGQPLIIGRFTKKASEKVGNE